MKQFLLLITFFVFVKVDALSYSEWSDIHPEGINEILIESEIRYKWYIKKEVNVEYLIKEKIGEKYVDYDDFQYTSLSEESIVEPQRYSERIIYEDYREYKFNENDVTHILIGGIKSNGYFKISEIVVTNKNNNEIINYSLDYDYNRYFNYKFINDGNFDKYIRVTSPTTISIELNAKYNLNDIEVNIYYKCDDDNTNSFIYTLASEKESVLYGIYYRNYTVPKCIVDCKLTFNSDFLDEKLDFLIPFYTFKDKVYKTYYLEKEYKEGYYKFLEGYTKDEDESKTFYRYITDRYIVVDADGNIVTDNDYCIKEVCLIMYIDEEKDVVVPAEILNTYDSLIEKIAKLVILIFIIFLSLFILIKKKIIFCRPNKLSNFVERI